MDTPITPTGDDRKIQIDSPEDLENWAARLGVTEDALRSAMIAVGPQVDKVMEYLLAGQAGTQQDG